MNSACLLQQARAAKTPQTHLDLCHPNLSAPSCAAGIMIEPLFSSFSTAAGLEFIIFAIFEMRYLLSIWRARRQAVADPWSTQHELSVLYARFYGALLCGIFLAYQFQRS